MLTLLVFIVLKLDERINTGAESWQNFCQNIHILKAKCWHRFWTSNLFLLSPDYKSNLHPQFDIFRYCELWEAKHFNYMTQNWDVHYQKYLLKIWTESTLEKLSKTGASRSSWKFILRIRSCIHEQHDNHLISSRFWRLLQNLLNFLQAGKEERLPGSRHMGKRLWWLVYGERHNYNLGKDTCLLRCTSKHIVKDILSPVCSKSWEVKSEQSMSAVSCHLLVLVCLLHTVQPIITNVMPWKFSLLLCLRLVQSRLILVWFYQTVSARENHK